MFMLVRMFLCKFFLAKKEKYDGKYGHKNILPVNIKQVKSKTGQKKNPIQSNYFSEWDFRVLPLAYT